MVSVHHASGNALSCHTQTYMSPVAGSLSASRVPTVATGTRAPCCTLGAPQTICSRFSLSPTFTWQMLRRSAVGCGCRRTISPTRSVCHVVWGGAGGACCFFGLASVVSTTAGAAASECSKRSASKRRDAGNGALKSPLRPLERSRRSIGIDLWLVRRTYKWQKHTSGPTIMEQKCDRCLWKIQNGGTLLLLAVVGINGQSLCVHWAGLTVLGSSHGSGFRREQRFGP